MHIAYAYTTIHKTTFKGEETMTNRIYLIIIVPILKFVVIQQTQLIKNDLNFALKSSKSTFKILKYVNMNILAIKTWK